jgi:Ca2+-binding RTX toxin-like protein
LIGSADGDTLTGAVGDDYLVGGLGVDRLNGGNGNDIFGDVGLDDAIDTMTGGAGRDTYRYLPIFGITAATAEDIVTDFVAGDGGDIIRLSSSNPNPFDQGRIRIVQDGADTKLMVLDNLGIARSVLCLVGVTATDLTAANFGGVPFVADNSIRINDNDESNTLLGGALGDTIYGNGGNDIINGYAGDDRLAGGDYADMIDGGFGNDRIAGEGGNDTIYGGEGSDVISGGSGDDIITGGDLNNVRADNDVFDGGLGDDRLNGGAGNDIYHFSRGDDRDVIVDTGGGDTLQFATDITMTDVSVVQIDGTHIEFRINNDSGRIRIFNGLNAGAAGAIEQIRFADGSSWRWADVLARASVGTAGDDRLKVIGSVTLEGLAGNDILFGSAIADTLIGGKGDDRVEGAGGDDVYVFNRGDGQDVIVDNAGVNTLEFGAGISTADVRLVRSATAL